MNTATRPPQLLQLNARTDGSGEAFIELPKVSAGERWIIERIAVACSSTADSAAIVYIADEATEATDQYAVDSTPNGNRAASEYPNGLVVPSGRRLVVRWIDADADVPAFVNVQYRRLVVGGGGN